MRSFGTYFLWGLLVSLLLNVGWIVVRMLRAQKGLEVDGVVAVGFSFWWLVAYTLIGALILSSIAILVRRVLQPS